MDQFLEGRSLCGKGRAGGIPPARVYLTASPDIQGLLDQGLTLLRGEGVGLDLGVHLVDEGLVGIALAFSLSRLC